MINIPNNLITDDNPLHPYYYDDDDIVYVPSIEDEFDDWYEDACMYPEDYSEPVLELLGLE